MMEYASVAALVAIAAVTVISTPGAAVSAVLSKVNAKVVYESTRLSVPDQGVGWRCGRPAAVAPGMSL